MLEAYPRERGGIVAGGSPLLPPQGLSPRARASADDGEIVVALIDGEAATLKRLYREAHHLRLQPANAAMAPLRLAPEAVQLIGVVTAVLREHSTV